MASADFIVTFLMLLLFSNRPFPIVDSVLQIVPSDANLSLSSFFVSPQLNWSGNLFSRPYVHRHICVVWIVAGCGSAHSAQSRFGQTT